MVRRWPDVTRHFLFKGDPARAAGPGLSYPEGRAGLSGCIREPPRSGGRPPNPED